MLFVARQHNANENERLVVVKFEDQVGLLCLNEDCSMSEAIAKMQNMFGIANKSTLVNLGYINQTSEIIKGASKISQIRPDQRRNGPKVIRLELS